MTVFRLLVAGVSATYSSVSSLDRVPRTEVGFLKIGLTGVASSIDDPPWPRNVEVMVVMKG